MRRRYIALAATLVFILAMLINHLALSSSSIPNDYLKQYYEYVLLLVEIILMRVVYVTKNEDTKNIVTGMTVIITVIYLLIFFYTLMSY